MSQERSSSGGEKRPYEVFGFTEEERLKWRVIQERFREIINDNQTKIHTIEVSSNNYDDVMDISRIFVGSTNPRDSTRDHLNESSS